MKKLTYNVQLIISVILVLLGCILTDVFNCWIYRSLAFIVGGLLFIVHPVVPRQLESAEKAIFWTRIAGIILILIGIFTRAHY